MAHAIALVDRDEEIDRLKERRTKKRKRNWYTADERWERVKTEARKLKSSPNRIVDRAVDAYLEALSKK